MSAPIQGYLCCNVSLNKGWISSSNIRGGPVLPFGEPVQINFLKRTYYAYGDVRGAEYGFSEDSAKTREDTLAWLRSIIVPEDPRKVFASWPADVRAAVSAGKVIVGMTREQVVTSIGYPSRSDTPDIAASTWKYWTTMDDAPVELRFGADGTLEKVSGPDGALRSVESSL